MTNAVALKKRMKGAELLTPKQRVFAEYFVSHYPKGTKKEAALHAGYSEKTCEKVGSLLTNALASVGRNPIKTGVVTGAMIDGSTSLFLDLALLFLYLTHTLTLTSIDLQSISYL